MPVMVAEDIHRHERLGIMRFHFRDQLPEVVRAEFVIQHPKVKNQTEPVVRLITQKLTDQFPIPADLTQ